MNTSPWLTVPLADYEGHMNAPQVAQLQTLSDLFAKALDAAQPASVAIIGVAGGNGLDRIDSTVTTRIAGYDVHAEYLTATKTRYPNLAGLNLIQADLASEPVNGAFDLVHAALVLEHAGTGLCLHNTLALVQGGGTLSIVLQRPSTLNSNEAAAVAPTGYTSLQNLAANFQIIDPEWMKTEAAARGFQLQTESTTPVASGKAMWHGIWRKS